MRDTSSNLLRKIFQSNSSFRPEECGEVYQVNRKFKKKKPFNCIIIFCKISLQIQGKIKNIHDKKPFKQLN